MLGTIMVFCTGEETINQLMLWLYTSAVLHRPAEEAKWCLVLPFLCLRDNDRVQCRRTAFSNTLPGILRTEIGL